MMDHQEGSFGWDPIEVRGQHYNEDKTKSSPSCTVFRSHGGHVWEITEVKYLVIQCDLMNNNGKTSFMINAKTKEDNKYHEKPE